MADIEDFKSNDTLEHQMTDDDNKRNKQRKVESNVANIEEECEQSITTTLKNGIPGTHSVFVKTWGCSHNISDSEYMSGLLSNYGYTVITDEDKCDLADVTMVKRAKIKSKYIVLAGCVPQASKQINELDGISVVGVQQIDRIVYVVEETLKGNKVQLFAQKRIKDETKNNKRYALHFLINSIRNYTL